MAKKEVPEDEGPSQEWLASYADAMTLLLAFFIMMFAFALIDEGKFFDFKVGVVAALGIPDPLTDNTSSILDKGTGISPEVGLTPLRPSNTQKLSMEELVQNLSEAGEVTEENAEELAELLDLKIELAGASEVVEVGIDERGVFIRFQKQILFSSGSADLEDEGLILLSTVAGTLQDITNSIEVEGHTDSQPTNGGNWPSNWELSAVRASGVVRYLIDPGELPAERLRATGLADTDPIGNNNTEEGRQENRRVEIVVRLEADDVDTANQLSDANADTADLSTDDIDSDDIDSDSNTDAGAGAGADAGAGSGADVDVDVDGDAVDPIDPDLADEAEADPDPIGDIDPIGDPIGLPAVPEQDE